ncbi:MAG: methytransferase partner Trm112 [Chloroflexi bacterium]|nr:methytransferase partner Trm112 [Chloroflexota bacterium]
MKRDLIEILACPVCRGSLSLSVAKEDDAEIIDGALECKKCPESYPIVGAIPNLLPPRSRP